MTPKDPPDHHSDEQADLLEELRKKFDPERMRQIGQETHAILEKLIQNKGERSGLE